MSAAACDHGASLGGCSYASCTARQEQYLSTALRRLLRSELCFSGSSAKPCPSGGMALGGMPNACAAVGQLHCQRTYHAVSMGIYHP